MTIKIKMCILSLSGCVQLLLDTLGSTLILSSNNMEHDGGGFRPNKQDVFEFIKQCGNLTDIDPDAVSQLYVSNTETKTTLFFYTVCKQYWTRS